MDSNTTGQGIAKKYLQQVSKRERQLEELLQLIETRRYRLMHPEINLSGTRNPGRPDSFERGMAALLDLENKYGEKLLAYEVFRESVLRKVLQLDDALCIEILYSVYFKNETIAKTAKALDYGSCQITRLHVRALQDFYTRFLEDGKPSTQSATLKA